MESNRRCSGSPSRATRRSAPGDGDPSTLPIRGRTSNRRSIGSRRVLRDRRLRPQFGRGMRPRTLVVASLRRCVGREGDHLARWQDRVGGVHPMGELGLISRERLSASRVPVLEIVRQPAQPSPPKTTTTPAAHRWFSVASARARSSRTHCSRRSAWSGARNHRPRWLGAWFGDLHPDWGQWHFDQVLRNLGTGGSK